MIRGLAFIFVVAAVLASSSCGPNGSIDGNAPIPGGKQDADSRTSDATVIETEPGDTSFDLTKCGYSLTSPSAVIHSQQLAMTPATLKVTVPVLIFQTKKDVTMNGTFVMESSLVRQSISYKSSASAYPDAAEVAAFIASSTGAGDATLVGSEDRAHIGEKNPDWAGLFCSVQPATRIQHNAAQNVVADFSQPVPFGLIVSGDADRLKAELGTKRTWKNIVAKIVESNNTSMPAGSALTGTVTMEPAAVSAGGGDIAVKITYNFGGADKNQMLGLPSNIVWYVDSAAHTVKSVQVDVVGGKPILFK